MSTSLPLTTLPNDFEAHLVLQDRRYVLQLRPKTDNCVVCVLLSNGRYQLRLHPKARPSVDSLQTLLDRELSTLAANEVRSIVKDTWQALGRIEQAAAIPVVLSAAQAAEKRMVILTRAHNRVLNKHMQFLVLLGRAPSDYSIHEATPPDLSVLAAALNDDGDEGEDDDNDEEEGDDDDDDDEENTKAGDDNDNNDEAGDDDEASDDDDETPGDVLDSTGTSWVIDFLDAILRDSAFRQSYGDQGGLHDLLECLVFWDEAHPFPDALLRRFMPNQGRPPGDAASGELKAPEPSVAKFLQPLVDANIVETHPNGHLCVPPWSRYYYQRRMRCNGRLRSVFASTLRILVELRLQPLESQAETWDGHMPPRVYLTPLAYMKIAVPYGKAEDGSAEWEQVGRRYQELQEQGVPMALQECPLDSLPVEGAETPQ